MYMYAKKKKLASLLLPPTPPLATLSLCCCFSQFGYPHKHCLAISSAECTTIRQWLQYTQCTCTCTYLAWYHGSLKKMYVLRMAVKSVSLTPATLLPHVGGALSSAVETISPSLFLSFSTVAVMSTVLRSASWLRRASSWAISSSEAESRTTPTVEPSVGESEHMYMYHERKERERINVQCTCTILSTRTLCNGPLSPSLSLSLSHTHTHHTIIL